MAEDPNAELERGIKYNNLNIVRYALKIGADPNYIIDRFGKLTPLMITVRTTGNRQIVKALLDAGADPNRQDVLGQTALMDAARSGSVSLVSLLINRGADETLVMNSARDGTATALDLCRHNGSPRACRQIILNKQKRQFKQQASNSLNLLSRQYSRSTGPTKEDWRLIFMNQKREEFCDNPEDLYKYLGALWGLAEILGVPYGDLMFDKSELCERLRLRLTQGLNVVEDL